MRVMDLVARCTTETCHTSIRLSMCEEQQYDNTQFSEKLRTEHCGAYNIADQQCYSKYTFVKTKGNALQLEFHPFSPKFLCERQEERWKEVGTCTASNRYWLRDVTYQNLDKYQN